MTFSSNISKNILNFLVNLAFIFRILIAYKTINKIKFYCLSLRLKFLNKFEL